MGVTYNLAINSLLLINDFQIASSPSDHSVFLEGAGPGVGGGVILPLAVSVSFAFKLLLTDVFISVVSD